MKLALRVVVSLACAALFAAPALADQKLQVAPADEYFGRQKISTLGIDNLIRDTDQRENFDPALASRLVGPLSAAEDALEDWASKYPHDSWIPKRAYLMSHLFWRMHSTDGDAMANRCRNLLFKQFPKSRYAVLGKVETPSMIAPESSARMPAPSDPAVK
jgi:TolA-binding protein